MHTGRASALWATHSGLGTISTEFVYSGCWHLDNGATSKFDDVLHEHGGLPHVLPLAVNLKFVLLDN